MEEIWKPEVTVAAVVCRAGRYLMVEEESSDGLCFNQPAGHLEAGESLVAATVRETLEETARHFTPEGLLGIYQVSVDTPAGGRAHYLRVALSGSVDEPVAGRALDSGIVRALWMSYEEIVAVRARHRSPLVLRCVDDHRRGSHLAPLDLLFCHPSAGVAA